MAGGTVPAGERAPGGRPKKLKGALDLLEVEAHARFSYQPESGLDPPQYSEPVFNEIEAQWVEWKRGIPPTVEWLGRGGQNPFLLAAFAQLHQAEHRAQEPSQVPQLKGASLRSYVASKLG
jgi:hypothetical protein